MAVCGNIDSAGVLFLGSPEEVESETSIMLERYTELLDAHIRIGIFVSSIVNRFSSMLVKPNYVYM
jgi:hypothetical protein